MFDGRRAMDEADYEKARNDFLEAARVEPDARSYAYAATASYKAGDVAGARHLMEEAAKRDGKSYSYLRILGYRALILLREGNGREGLDALGAYIAAYKTCIPLNDDRRRRAHAEKRARRPPPAWKGSWTSESRPTRTTWSFSGAPRVDGTARGRPRRRTRAPAKRETTGRDPRKNPAPRYPHPHGPRLRRGAPLPSRGGGDQLSASLW